MKIENLSYKELVNEELINWLLSGDVSIQYQVHRDLISDEEEVLSTLNKRIETEGWGYEYLKNQNPDGHWGRGFYQPKWTSTHYTLLELKNIQINPENELIKRSSEMVLEQPIGIDGGINLAKTVKYSDICLNGMILNYCSYFSPKSGKLNLLVDYLLDHQFKDGGWNCEYRSGADHSSLHTTVSVLEGFTEFKKVSKYRKNEINIQIKDAVEFILHHKMYKSDKTGKIINPQFTKLFYPSRWRYDILRCFEVFVKLNIKYDKRMDDAFNLLLKKMDNINRFPLQQKHKGEVFFDYETVSQPSRWNTLRGLRVIKHFF